MDSLRDMRLVEKAAKAAGYGVARWSDDGRGLLLVGVQEPWNPLEDDGDALRLVVKLRLEIQFIGDQACASGIVARGTDAAECCRRAITGAAAALADN